MRSDPPGRPARYRRFPGRTHNRPDGADGTDKGDADGRGNGGVEGIARTAQTSHVHDLADLENNHENDDMHDSDTDHDNHLLLKEKSHERRGAHIINDGQTGGNNTAEHPAYAAVFFGQFFIPGAETASDQRYRSGL